MILIYADGLVNAHWYASEILKLKSTGLNEYDGARLVSGPSQLREPGADVSELRIVGPLSAHTESMATEAQEHGIKVTLV